MRVLLLGPLEVRDARDAAIDLGPPRQRALLALLALHGPYPVSVDALIDGLWPEGSPPSARNAIQVYVSGLRRAIGGKVVVTTEGGYRLDLAPDDFDWIVFERLVQQGRDSLRAGRMFEAAALLARALAAWRTDEIDAMSLPPPVARAVALQELRLTTIEDRIDAQLAVGDASEIVHELRALVEVHPYRERMRCQLALALYRAGRQADALRSLAEGRAIASDELGLDPGPELAQLERMILTHAIVRERPTVRLPTSVTPLVGREDDLVAAVEAFACVRLMTVTGAGGVGKTRFAIELAGQTIEQRGRDAFFVDFAVAARTADVAVVVASALGVRRASEATTIEALAEWLHDRAALLVWDNCEHLAGSLAVLAVDLLERCPNVTILATSRQPLGVPGERTWPLGPLGRHAATTLFEARAREAQPSFRLDDATGPAVTQICERLGGLPLAIELAAARARALSAEQISELLNEPELLHDTSPARPKRHHSLAAVMEWSYDLLSDHEQDMLREASAFAGAFSLSDVAVVQARSAASLVDVMSSLIDWSLITRFDGTDGSTRYRLVETVREFAVAKRNHRGDGVNVQRRHLAWCVGLADDARRSWHGHSLAAIDRLDEAVDDVRAGLAFAQVDTDAVSFGRLAAGIAWPWFLRGRLQEARGLLDRALAVCDAKTGAPRVFQELLFGRASVGLALGEFDIVGEAAGAMLRLAEQLGDRCGAGSALACLATRAWALGDAAWSAVLYERALAAATQGGDVFGASTVLAQAGRLAHDQGDRTRAIDAVDRALTLALAIDDAFAVALASDFRARIAIDDGDLPAASALADTALRHYRLARYEEGVASALDTAADVAAASGERDLASAYAAEANEVARRIGMRR